MQNNLPSQQSAFTLIELLVALALMAVLIPVVVHALQISTLAGEVAQRKALAARLGERVLNEAIVNGQAQSAQRGSENIGGYPFNWTVTDAPWDQMNGLTTSTSANGVNQ